MQRAPTNAVKTNARAVSTKPGQQRRPSSVRRLDVNHARWRRRSCQRADQLGQQAEVTSLLAAERTAVDPNVDERMQAPASIH